VDPGQMTAVDIDDDVVEELVVSFPVMDFITSTRPTAGSRSNDVVPDDMKPINFYP